MILCAIFGGYILLLGEGRNTSLVDVITMKNNRKLNAKDLELSYYHVILLAYYHDACAGHEDIDFYLQPAWSTQ